jgi:Phosphotransferase enzyme family
MATDQITQVAEQLYEHTKRVAKSGAVISSKPTKTTFILDCDDGSYVVSAYRDDDYCRARSVAARVGMQLASRHDLSPCPIDFEAASLLHGYRFAAGAALDNYQSLAKSYYIIGGVAAQLHRIEMPLKIYLEKLMGRFRDVELPGWVLKRVISDDTVRPSVFLHGDLNSANLIATQQGYLAIDFDNCGTGPPELDLAISLGYVNTHQADWLSCFSAIVNGYRDIGGMLSLRRLMELATTVPYYMLCSCAGSVCTKDSMEFQLEAAHNQHRDIESALAKLGAQTSRLVGSILADHTDRPAGISLQPVDQKPF